MSLSATNNGESNVTQKSDFSISNSQWNKIKIGGWTHTHGSSSAYIKIGSTTIWSNGSPTTEINISEYKGQTILFHTQVYGAYQSTSINNIVLSN